MIRLKEIREAHNLLQKEITKITNVSQRGYSNYEYERIIMEKQKVGSSEFILINN